MANLLKYSCISYVFLYPVYPFFSSLGEAIEKMLQEKKISSKINYEVLKSLNNQQQNTQELSATNTSELDDVTNIDKLLVIY